MTEPATAETLISVEHPTDRPNLTLVRLPGLAVWFSYRTPVAFHVYDGKTYRYDTFVVTRNLWGPTTGRHLTYIDGGGKEAVARRLPWDKFEAAYRKAVTLATRSTR
jgi:hypothetical protein